MVHFYVIIIVHVFVIIMVSIFLKLRKRFKTSAPLLCSTSYLLLASYLLLTNCCCCCFVTVIICFVCLCVCVCERESERERGPRDGCNHRVSSLARLIQFTALDLHEDKLFGTKEVICYNYRL